MYKEQGRQAAKPGTCGSGQNFTGEEQGRGGFVA